MLYISVLEIVDVKAQLYHQRYDNLGPCPQVQSACSYTGKIIIIGDY